MCFSQPLTKKEGMAHLTDHGWVYVGHKIVLQLRRDLFLPVWGMGDLVIPIRYLEPCNSPHMSDYRRLDMVDALKGVFGRQEGASDEKLAVTHFPERQIVVDRGHGLHVANDENCAANMVRQNVKQVAVCVPESAKPMRADQCDAPRHIEHFMAYKVDKPFALCRVLVPESAIRDDHHVEALMLIPPLERETEDDIERCGRWMNGNYPARGRTTHDLPKSPEIVLDEVAVASP